MNKFKFEELNLSPAMIKAISEMGFEEATPIQTEAIPSIMAGKDIIGHAQTGTGKTAAFAIPTIEMIDTNLNYIQAIVLCPTRELVMQVTEEFRKLMRYKEGMSVLAIYGGQEIDRQFKALKKNPQIIVGTPGRTIDHIHRGSIKLDSIKFVVLDEADEMLDMGFREDIELILSGTPEYRQTVMFSATLPEIIMKLMKRFQKNPVRIDVTHHKLHAPKIDQFYFEVNASAKPEALARLIDYHSIKLALVFCNTRSQVDELVDILKTRGYFADGLHGDMNQRQREKVMGGFRTGSVEILVATDVAGRGIDVNDIEAVFNYDLPQDDEDYIHRIGRTGRAGKTGAAYSFVTGRQMYNLQRIERSNNVKLQKRLIPTMEDLDETRIQTIFETIKPIIAKGSLKKYRNLTEEMMGEDYNSMDIAAALLKITLDARNDGFDSKIVIEDRYHDRSDRNDRSKRRDSGGRDSGRRDSGRDYGRDSGRDRYSSGKKEGKKDSKDNSFFEKKKKKKIR
jgi:ATP-dependent RNA helicase DeaD